MEPGIGARCGSGGDGGTGRPLLRNPGDTAAATGAMGVTGVMAATAASRLAGLRLPGSSPSAQA